MVFALSLVQKFGLSVSRPYALSYAKWFTRARVMRKIAVYGGLDVCPDGRRCSFCGVSKNGISSKVDYVSAAILPGLMDLGKAIGVMLSLLILMDLSNLRAYWRKWSRDHALTLFLGDISG